MFLTFFSQTGCSSSNSNGDISKNAPKAFSSEASIAASCTLTCLSSYSTAHKKIIGTNTIFIRKAGFTIVLLTAISAMLKASTVQKKVRLLEVKWMRSHRTGRRTNRCIILISLKNCGICVTLLLLGLLVLLLLVAYGPSFCE